MKQLFIKSLKGYKKHLLIVLICTFIQSGLLIYAPLLIGEYIDNIYISVKKQLIILVLMYFLTILICSLLRIFTVFLFEKVGLSIFNKIRCNLVDKILTFDQHFFNNNSVGEILEYVDRGIKIISNFFTTQAFEMVVSVLTIIVMLIVLFSKNIFIGLVFTVYIFISFLIIYNSIRKKQYTVNDYQKNLSYAFGKYGEWIEARNDIFNLSEEKYILKKMEVIDDKLVKSEVRSQKFLYIIWSLTMFLVGGLCVGSLLVGGTLFFIGSVTLGTVYIAYTYSTMLKAPFENFQSQLQSLIRAKTMWKRIDEMLKYKNEVNNGNDLCDNKINMIEIKDVKYNYPNKNLVLSYPNIEIKQGEIIGISGNSGCGKSTLCKILCKMIEPSEGTILINKTSLKFINTNSYYKNIAYTSNNIYIFNGSIRDNLTLFDKSIRDEFIIKILEKNNLINYFKKFGEDFLDYIIEEDNISVAIKQLINISRVLLLEKSFIILDESISKIDLEMFDIFLEILNSIKNETLILIISHDYSILQHCNSVIKL